MKVKGTKPQGWYVYQRQAVVLVNSRQAPPPCSGDHDKLWSLLDRGAAEVTCEVCGGTFRLLIEDEDFPTPLPTEGLLVGELQCVMGQWYVHVDGDKYILLDAYKTFGRLLDSRDGAMEGTIAFEGLKAVVILRPRVDHLLVADFVRLVKTRGG
jgi:hypothetical protein